MPIYNTEDNVLTITETSPHEVVGPAAQIIREHKPDVMFVHFPSVDNVGHKIGWATPEQMKIIEYSDTCVGELLKVLETE